MEFIGFSVNIGFFLLKFQKIFRARNGENNNFYSIFTNFARSTFRAKPQILCMVSVLNYLNI